MRLSLAFNGPAFKVYALDFADAGPPDCPAMDFILGLEKPAYQKLRRTIDSHAERGPLLDETISREIRDGIFEFKGRKDTPRVLYFYAPGHRTILTHGFKKGARLNVEVDKALRYRAQWEGEQWLTTRYPQPPRLGGSR